MANITFKVDMRPQGKARARSGRYGHYTPERSREAEQKIAWAWIDAYGKEHGNVRMFEKSEPLRVIIDARFKPPSNISKNRQSEMIANFHVIRPDADNIAKLVCDALNGIAYYDDTQIACLNVCKRYDAEDSITVTVESLNGN